MVVRSHLVLEVPAINAVTLFVPGLGLVQTPLKKLKEVYNGGASALHTLLAPPMGLPVIPSVIPSSLAILDSAFRRCLLSLPVFALISSLNTWTSFGLE